MNCVICNREGLISKELKVCLSCIRERKDEAIKIAKEVHGKSRRTFNLPETPPRASDGAKCDICVNACSIPADGVGYCGLRINSGNKVVSIYGGPENGLLDWYFDSLPTNCVAEWVCPGREKYGYKNLAVFYRACSFNCLFCQNWHFKRGRKVGISAEELAAVADNRTYCICFFGGDPATQVEHAIEVSKLLKDRVRICWETNGSVSRKYLKKMAELSWESGGCIKFDLKCWDENLNYVLTGSTNKNTINNFSFLANMYKGEKRDSPFLVASTLMIPGYIDEKEVDCISSFISQLDPEIPYSLLAFYPNFYFYDLPTPTKKYAFRLYEISKANGLKNVNIGNISLLR